MRITQPAKQIPMQLDHRLTSPNGETIQLLHLQLSVIPTLAVPTSQLLLQQFLKRSSLMKLLVKLKHKMVYLSYIVAVQLAFSIAPNPTILELQPHSKLRLGATLQSLSRTHNTADKYLAILVILILKLQARSVVAICSKTA